MQDRTKYRAGSWFLAILTLLALCRALPAIDKEKDKEFRDAFARAESLRQKGRDAEAERYYLKALELAPKVFGEDHVNTAVICNNLANLYRDQGKYARAEPLFQRSLRIEEKVRGPEHLAVATSLNNLANLYTDQARYSKAEPLLQRSLRIREKVLGPEHLDVTLTLNNLGVMYFNQGQYGKAEPLLQRSLRIREKALGPEHRDVAQSLNNLANVFFAQGQYGKAEPLYQRCLRIREKVLGAEHLEVAQTLNNLASLYWHQSLYSKAEPLYQRSLRIREKGLGAEHPALATGLLNLSSVYSAQGRYGEAEPLIQRSLRIREKALGPEHPLVATCLNNLALIYKDQGQYARAEPFLQRSLHICEKAVGPEHPDTVDTLHNLAVVYSALGRNREAEPLFQRVLRIRETVLSSQLPELARSLNGLATVYLVQGQHGKAEPLFQRSLQINEKVFGRDHPAISDNLYNLALLHSAQKRWDQAASLFDRQRRGSRRFTDRELTTLPQAEQLAFLRKIDRDQLHAALTLGWIRRADPALAQRSAGWLLNGKALAHQALARRVLLERAAADPALRPIVRQLQELRTRQAALVFAPVPAGKEEQRRQEMLDLAQQQQKLERQLGQFAGSTAPAGDPWLELDAVRRALPTDGVLLELVRFNPLDPATLRSQPARYAAWLIPAAGKGDVRVIDLGPADVIDRAIPAARKVLADTNDIDTVLRPPLEALAKLVLHPLLPHIGKTRRWLISPDGNLWLVPWATLPLPDRTYAIEQHPISYLVSGRDLLASVPSVKLLRPVMLADPDFDLDPAQARVQAVQLLGKNGVPSSATRSLTPTVRLPRVGRLPGTAAEAAAVAPKLQAYTQGKPWVYTGAQALEAVFKSCRSPRVLMLSTHGFFLENQEPVPAAKPGIDDPKKPALTREGKPLENPLLRCGVLLAGCNRRDRLEEGDEDGILTGLEIVGTDLRGTELVVLSACETGLGQVQNGEGVAGLRQAFQLAGAQSVTATLWQIPDRETARLMTDFFGHLAAGKGKADALREAQLSMLRAKGTAHPFYWAAFTVTGRAQ